MFLVRFYVLPGERVSKKFLPSPLKNGRLLRTLTLNTSVFVQKYGLTVRRGVVGGRLVRLLKFLFIINWFDQKATVFGWFYTNLS